MMKFLYGLVLLVATLPLSAATPPRRTEQTYDVEHIGFAVFIKPINPGDCTDAYMADVWSKLEDIAGDVSPAYAGTIMPVGGTTRRKLRGDPWKQQRELTHECLNPCNFAFCCSYVNPEYYYCGCNECYQDCNRRDLEFLENETRLLTQHIHLTELEVPFLVDLKERAAADADVGCLGIADELTVDVMH